MAVAYQFRSFIQEGRDRIQVWWERLLGNLFIDMGIPRRLALVLFGASAGRFFSAHSVMLRLLHDNIFGQAMFLSCNQEPTRSGAPSLRR